MGQYFKVVNHAKKEYLEPFNMRASARFSSLLGAHEMTRAISWLVCTSTNPAWLTLKDKNNRTERIIGSWCGDPVEIIGDYSEEELCYLVRDQYVDISYEVVATLFDCDSSYLDEAIEELRAHPFLLEKLGVLMMIAEPPEQLGIKLQSIYPAGWQKEFAKLVQNRVE